MARSGNIKADTTNGINQMKKPKSPIFRYLFIYLAPSGYPAQDFADLLFD